jgi:DNA-binding winged helix-turn-helix (wHTH) protein
MDSSQFAFGSFVLDTSRGLLLEAGAPVAVGNRGLALLQALVTAGGRVVTKSDLMDAAWPNTNVEESNLTVQIAQLRKRLGMGAESEEWIATVPRSVWASGRRSREG